MKKIFSPNSHVQGKREVVRFLVHTSTEKLITVIEAWNVTEKNKCYPKS